MRKPYCYLLEYRPPLLPDTVIFKSPKQNRHAFPVYRAPPPEFTSKELFLLRQAVRIATEDGSLSGFASDRTIQRLADKLEKPESGD
jgi:hypothetical protein